MPLLLTSVQNPQKCDILALVLLLISHYFTLRNYLKALSHSPAQASLWTIILRLYGLDPCPLLCGVAVCHQSLFIAVIDHVTQNYYEYLITALPHHTAHVIGYLESQV